MGAQTLTGVETRFLRSARAADARKREAALTTGSFRLLGIAVCAALAGSLTASAEAAVHPHGGGHAAHGGAMHMAHGGAMPMHMAHGGAMHVAHGARFQGALCGGYSHAYVRRGGYAYGHGYGWSGGYAYRHRYGWRGGYAYGGTVGGYAYPYSTGGAYYAGGNGYHHHSCWWYRHYDPYATPSWCGVYGVYTGPSYGYSYGYSAPYGYGSYGYGYGYRRGWRGYHGHYAAVGGGWRRRSCRRRALGRDACRRPRARICRRSRRRPLRRTSARPCEPLSFEPPRAIFPSGAREDGVRLCAKVWFAPNSADNRPQRAQY